MCFPGQFLPTHFHWVYTWQLDNCLIFLSVIASPCKSRRLLLWKDTEQPDLSDPVTEVGSLVLTVLKSCSQNKDWEKEGTDSGHSPASPAHKAGLGKGWYTLWYPADAGVPQTCIVHMKKINNSKV